MSDNHECPAQTESTAAGWRADCRSYARAQAEAEARARWQVAADAVIPFNYRWEHVQEVARLACALAAATGADPEVAEAAAWLHDICKGQPEHARAGACAAARFLAGTDFPPAKVAAVAGAIAQHEGLTRPAGAPPMQPTEAAVLWDADKLSKLGVQALFYSAATVHTLGKTLPQRRQDLADFTVKTLRQTVASMNSAPARREAERRYQEMVAALNAWASEEGEPTF